VAGEDQKSGTVRQLAQTHSREPSCMRLAPCGCRRHDNTKHVPRLQRGCAISSPTTTASVFRRVYLLGSCHFHPYKDTLVCHLTWSACVASQIDLQALVLAVKLGAAVLVGSWGRRSGAATPQTLRGRKRNSHPSSHHRKTLFGSSSIRPDPASRHVLDWTALPVANRWGPL
jgi:hypothetical protein